MSFAAARRLVSCALLALLFLPVCFASEFWSESVAVDVTAENAVAARNKGLEQGQRQALARLLERLVPQEERSRLPRAETLSPARFVRALEIRDERVGPNRWLATVVVSFDPDAVRELLAGAGIAMAQPDRVPAVLIVPAVQREGAILLWAREDPWWQVWERVVAEERGLELRLPLGDVRDLAVLDAEEIAVRDRAALDQLAERYATADAAVALLVEEDEGRAREAMPRVEVFAGNGVLRGERATVEPLRGEGELLERAARATVRHLLESWKRQAVVRTDELAELVVVVPLADLASWLQIRRQIEATPDIRAVRMLAMARERVELVLSYSGNLARLREALARRGLELVEEGEGWRLRRAAGPPAIGPG